MKIPDYDIIIFDFDGVIIDSNKAKSDAFLEVFSEYDLTNLGGIDTYLNSSVNNQGVTRFERFDFFLNNILNLRQSEIEIERYKIEKRYQEISLKKVKKSKKTSLFESTDISYNNFFIVSAAFEMDLIETIKFFELDKNIPIDNVFGSPKSKKKNIEILFDKNKIKKTDNVLLIGDSLSDYKVSNLFGFDFLFVYQWSGESEDTIKQMRFNFPSVKFLSDIIL